VRASRGLRAVLHAVAVLVFGAFGFFAGTVVGSQSRMDISLSINTAEGIDGEITRRESSDWNTLEIATAICKTRTGLGRFEYNHSSRPAEKFEFSCPEPGKETQ